MKKWLLAIISLALTTALLCGCVSSDDMMNEMKEQLPNVRAFIDLNADSLAVLISTQRRLEDIVIEVAKDEYARVFDYSNGKWGALSTETSLSDASILFDDERNAIIDILSQIEDSNACVQIFPELILILYISQSRERQVADMIIRRGDHYRSYDSGNYFHERIDDYWSMEILLSKRG